MRVKRSILTCCALSFMLATGQGLAPISSAQNGEHYTPSQINKMQQSYLRGYSKKGISRMFLDAHAPDQPPKYSRSEIKERIRDAKTAEDFERLGDYFDYQSLVFERKAEEEVKELERLLALRYHARNYPTQVDYTRELIKKYRIKANECSARATAYRSCVVERQGIEETALTR